MTTAHEDPNIWLWIAGVAVAAASGLNMFVLKSHAALLGNLSEQVKEVSAEREDHCINRHECERTHEALNERLDAMAVDIKSILLSCQNKVCK